MNRDAVGMPALFCSPPRLAADTPTKRFADRVLPTGTGQWIFFGVIWAVVLTMDGLPARAGLLLGAVATIAGAAWCLVNFWRCREAHCALTGPAWGLLAIVEVLGATKGHSLVKGTEPFLFIGIFVLAYAFEFIWQARRGTNALQVR